MVPTIAILGAGNSERWKVTARAVKKALNSLQYNTVDIDVNKYIAEKLKTVNPDLAFIANHRYYCKYGNVQGLLETLGIKYTHSGVLASAIGGNKVMSKHIFQSISIDTPVGYVVRKKDILEGNIKMDYPFILKPIDECGSRGLHHIFSYDDFLKLRNEPSDIREEMILEEYIPGVDLSTAVLLDEAVGTIEIRTKSGFYDHETKHTSALFEKKLALEIPKTIYKMSLEWAVKAHRFLGCRTISRSDFRYNPKDDSLKMLEINTHPGLNENASLPVIVKLARGIDRKDLINMIIKDGLQP